MTFSPFNLEPKRLEAAYVFGQVSDSLQLAYERARARGLNLKDIADRMGVNKSHVSRLLNGEANMTLRSMAYLAHALDHTWELQLRDKSNAVGNHAPDVMPSIVLEAVETSNEGDDSSSAPIEISTGSFSAPLYRTSSVDHAPDEIDTYLYEDAA